MKSKSYKHIFFDLDHTLWDFEKNSSETLSELYDLYNMDELPGFNKKKFIDTFHEVNLYLWSCFHRGILKKDQLRHERFAMIFKRLNVQYPYSTERLTEEYLSLCPTKTNLFPYTMEVLKYLKERYILHIITNGFKDIQFLKLTNTEITPFFSEIITADVSGFNKPHRGIFDFAMQRVNAYCIDCIMVGDDLEADIAGARNASIDHVFFNPAGVKHHEDVTYEIQCLSQLMKIL